MFVVLSLLGCTENEFYELKERDAFQQNRRQAVDLLVVIDNSCSMWEEQDNLARNFQELVTTFDAADVDWRIAATTTDTEVERYRGLLIAGDDEVILRGPQGEIDRVQYDREWPFAAGTALQLLPDKYKWNSNDTVLSWCAAPGTFGEGGHGSPGEWNPACDGSAAPPDTSGADAGPREPVAGDLVVSEIMAWSGGLDSQCEWFELTNVTADTLTLSGLEIADIGRNLVALPEGASIPPFGVQVVGRNLTGNCGTPVDYAFADGFSLFQDIAWIDRDTPDNEELFSEMVAQGTLGTGFEMGLEAARLVFEPEYYDTQNLGFIRGDHRAPYDTPDDDFEEANFSILFVSDEEDYSPYPTDAYVRYFTDLKGDVAYRNRQVVNLSGVIGKDPPASQGLPSCESASGVASYGQRYLAAINETNGLAESICADNFAPIVAELGLTLSGLSLDFELSEYPQLDTLVVSLYETEETESFQRELVRDVDFTYMADGNLLHFSESQVPPSEWWVVAEYVVQATANVDTDGGAE